MRASLKTQEPLRSGTHATLVLSGVLLAVNLAVFAMMWTGLRQGRNHREEQARGTSRNLAQVLERNLSGEIQAIDLALFSVKQEIAREQGAGGIHTAQLNAYIRNVFARYPNLDAIRTVDESGEVGHGIGLPPGPRASIADRDYFQILKQNASAGLVISKPVLGRISQKWVIILARRLDTPDGRFGGVVYGVLPLEEFTRSLSLVDAGPQGTVALRDGELGLLARYPYAKGISDRVGDHKLSPAFQSLIEAGQTSGTYFTRGVLDGVERTFSFRKVGPHPLYVNVGLASVDYLSEWRGEARKTLGAFSLFCLSSILLGRFLYRDWRRNQQRIEDLRRALEEVHTLQEFLPICMYCKKVRDDQNYWTQIEQYITKHTGSMFTHGICPECRPRLMEEFRLAEGPASPNHDDAAGPDGAG